MNKNSGSNLVEYVIPLAIIGVIVGLGLITMFGDGTEIYYWQW